jgi:uncharacterized protein YkwD
VLCRNAKREIVASSKVVSDGPMPEARNRRDGKAAKRLLWGLAAVSVFVCASSPVVGDQNVSLSPMEQGLAAEINVLRTDPAGYASVLNAWRPFYHGLRFETPRTENQNIEVSVEVTQEGLPALDEAVAALRSAHRRARLKLSNALCKAAHDHLLKQGEAGTMGHPDPNGEDPFARVKRYLPGIRLVGENLSYGRRTAKDVVFHLLVDDGVPDRGHRKDLLDPRFDSIGVACGYHKVYGIMCVIDLAAEL